MSIEEKMAAIADDTAKIRVDGFQRITRLETQMTQVVTKDVPGLQTAVSDLQQVFSAKRILFYSGGTAGLIVALVNIARAVKLIP